MDLITHIAGHTNSGSFSPGAGTPPPFNIAHTGAVDGSGPASATRNMSEITNRLLLDRAALINMLGATLDNTNWAQAAAVLKAYLDTMSANTAALNTNLNTLSSALSAEVTSRQSGELKRCGLRRAAAQAVGNGGGQDIGMTDAMGQAWNVGSTIVIPAGTPAGTWFSVHGGAALIRQAGSTTGIQLSIMKNGVGVENSSKVEDSVGGWSIFDFVVQAGAGDVFKLHMLNFSGGTVEVGSASLVVERF